MASRLNANLLRINTLAFTDPITSLPNRSVIDHLLRQASRRILEQGLGRTLETIATCTDPFGNPCSRLPGQTNRAALLQVGEAIIAAPVAVTA